VDLLYRLGHPQVQLVASRQGEAADWGLADEVVGEDEGGFRPIAGDPDEVGMLRIVDPVHEGV
jgi:hypothetical protein